MEEEREDLKQIYKYHLNIDVNDIAPAPDKSQVEQCQFILIRHAVTKFNVLFSDIVAKYGVESEEYRKLKVNPECLDLSILEEGIPQCENQQQNANQINFKYIFVSPMIRTIQTAIHMFKNHPNKPSLKLILLPILKEGMNTSNDLSGTYEYMKKHIEPLAVETNIQLDYSLLTCYGNSDLYQANVLTELERIKIVYSSITNEKQRDIDQGYNEQILKLVYDEFPLRIEGPQQVFERGLILRKFLKNYLQHNPLEGNEKCAIVSHSTMVSALSSRRYDYENERLIDGKPFKNQTKQEEKMGTNISIDKHVSSLDDILEMPPNYFDKIKFESKVSANITQHLKIWKFSEDKRKFDNVKSSPVPLHHLQSNGFYFSSEEAYLILLIYKSGSEEQSNLVSFPHSLWGVVQSAENLTPRGLSNTFSSNVQEPFQNHALDSFLLSRRRDEAEAKKGEENTSQQYKYMIFVWNGKNAPAMVKAMTITKGYELDTLLSRAKDQVLQVLFAGGVIRGKKLQRGSVFQFDETIDSKFKDKNLNKKDNPNAPSPEQILKAYETVYLFKWLFPERLIKQEVKQVQQKQPIYSKLIQTFKTTSKADYYENFQDIDDLLDFDTDNEEMNYEDDDDDYLDDSDQEMDYEQDEKQKVENILSREQEKLQQKKGPEIPKLGLGGNNKVPAMNKLNLAQVQQYKQDEELKEKDTNIQQRQPPTKGFNLDLSKAKKPQQEDNNQDSQRELVQSQQEKVPPLKLGMGKQAPEKEQQNQLGKPKMGLGLDLTRAKNYQQENLEKNEQVIQQAKDKSNQETKETPSLSINIQNLNKIKQLGSHDEPPALKRGDPDQPMPDSLRSGISSSQESEPFSSERFGKNQNSNLVPPEQLTDEDFDMQGTSRKEYENEYFKRICSEILEGQIYLGSDLVAQDKETFDKIGITHVINCAADYSANYFYPQVKYKSYHLKDHVRENIECVFYDAIFFIEEALNQDGKVFIHCVQGISRSATIILAYLIFKMKMTQHESLNFVLEKRSIVNPNMTFIAQLICFYKRLYETSYESIPVSPRVFAIGSHEIEEPERVVSRMIMENLYHGNNLKTLDPRGMFIIQAKDELRLWIGDQIAQGNYEDYYKCAQDTIQILQKYERAPSKVIQTKQGEEDVGFWKLFGFDKPPSISYGLVSEWNTWYADLEKAKQEVKKAPVVTQMQNYQEEINQEKHYKPRIYTYPDINESSAVFDLDDLNEDLMLVLCVRANPSYNIDKDKLFIWQGETFEPQQTQPEDYINQACLEYWGEEYKKKDIARVEEEPGEESEEFLNYFD